MLSMINPVSLPIKGGNAQSTRQATQPAAPRFGQDQPDEPVQKTSGTSRRGFFKNAALLGAGVFAGYVLHKPLDEVIFSPAKQPEESYSLRADLENNTIGGVFGIGDGLIIASRPSGVYELHDEASIERGEDLLEDLLEEAQKKRRFL